MCKMAFFAEHINKIINSYLFQYNVKILTDKDAMEWAL